MNYENLIALNELIETPAEYYEDEAKDRPRVVEVKFKRTRILESDLEAAGWKRTKNSKPVYHTECVQWLDMEHGDFLNREQVKERGVTVAPSKSSRMLLTQAIILSCPKPQQDFVRYMLKLRNKGGGLIISQKKAIDLWIDHAYAGIRSTDRARKFKSLQAFLYKHGIMLNETKFTTHLMIQGKSTTKELAGEESQIVRVLPPKAKPGCGLPKSETEIDWKAWSDRFRASTDRLTEPYRQSAA
ncbi:hypothetical protein [Caballeronia sp. AZ1_KS37]|uniref:hypothetical protein n=1 Tax=Caballeronia sp. AZ1_KS37 TaxID=2921756 RepID=UPI0020293C9F|nr:hypothetical protein [Caballeronia sp. AZ1_KS37]